MNYDVHGVIITYPNHHLSPNDLWSLSEHYDTRTYEVHFSEWQPLFPQVAGQPLANDDEDSNDEDSINDEAAMSRTAMTRTLMTTTPSSRS